MKNKYFFPEPKKSKQSGFTLIEVIVSLAVLSLVMISLSYVSQMAVRSWESARNRSIAYNILQDAVESIRNARDTNSNSNRGWFNADDANIIDNTYLDMPNNPLLMTLPDGFTRSFSVEPRVSEVTYGGTNLADSKKKVTITISWRDRGKEKTLVGTTYFTDWKSKY